MIEIKTEVRKWGNSLAVVLPKNKVKNINIKAGKKLTIMIPEGTVDLRKEFGSLSRELKKPTKELMRIIDEGWE